jgi:hypothetical protein
MWCQSNGDLALWMMNGVTVMSSAALGNVPTNWTVIGTGDFNGDCMSDILWQDNSATPRSFVNGTTVPSAAGVGTTAMATATSLGRTPAATRRCGS